MSRHEERPLGLWQASRKHLLSHRGAIGGFAFCTHRDHNLSTSLHVCVCAVCNLLPTSCAQAPLARLNR